MSWHAAHRLARTLIYEGYVLYPYRRSNLKNAQRWAFGTLFPPAFCSEASSDRHTMRVECLVTGASPSVRGTVHFLQFAERRDANAPHASPWNEAIEHNIGLAEMRAAAGATSQTSVVLNISGSEYGRPDERLVRHALRGRIVQELGSLEKDVWRASIEIRNEETCGAGTPLHTAMLRSFASLHMILTCSGGAFVSSTDPPAALHTHAGRCRSEGVYPVLVGGRPEADTLLASPLILQDYPQLAPESPDAFFDCTEIDEILALRVLTMTPEEKAEAAATDPRSRALIERVSAMSPDELSALHGTWRTGRQSRAETKGFQVGQRIRLNPKGRSDVFDVALRGETATIIGVEEDFEGGIFLTVTVDRDPGRDLGEQGFSGHRFFFRPEDVESLS